MNNYLHTVEGLRDIHPEEASIKKRIEEYVMQTFERYGYKLVETPTFEYLDIFRTERGTKDSKNLYKFFNREGDILALRPDVTPSIARYMATFYEVSKSIKRFCYLGNVFYNNENYQGKLREYTQAGVECIGTKNIDSDAESIALAINAILNTGLNKFQIDIGHVDFFNGLILEAGFNEDEKEEVRKLIDEKNYIALEELLNNLNCDEEVAKGLITLPTLFGDISVMDKLEDLKLNKISLQGINHIKQVYEILKSYGVENYVNIDLGMVNQLQYYTGIIFKGYTYDVGTSIVDGGRYDKLISTYGKDTPAVGFAIKIDQIMRAIERQSISIETKNIDTIMVYNEDNRILGIKLAEVLRSQGMSVEVAYDLMEELELLEYASSKKAGGIMTVLDEENITLLNVKTKEKQVCCINDLIGGEK